MERIAAMQAATINVFDEVDRQLAALTSAATASCVPTTASAIPVAIVRPVSAPVHTDAIFADAHERRTMMLIAAAVLAALGAGLIIALIFHVIADRETLTGRAAIESVVSRIIAAESRSAVDARNTRSSAAGPAQFIDDTWLETIRAFRPDLMKGRSRDQILELRRKPELAREIAVRFAERNAALLKRRGLPVTAATLYLAHFAGPAGAVALLAAPNDADAAQVMAKADSTGKTRREQIAKANPFLDKFSVADLRRWAERKMAGPRILLTELLGARK
jgi:hypothetical protein